MPKKKAEKEQPRADRTAIHEAGHAVVMMLLRRKFQYVSVIPEEIENIRTSGHVRFTRATFRAYVREGDAWKPADKRHWHKAYEREAVIACAGYAAEWAYFIDGQPIPHNAPDIKDAHTYAERLGSMSEGEQREQVNRWLRQAYGLIHDWRILLAVERLAFAVHEAKSLRYLEARKVVNYALAESCLRLSPAAGGVEFASEERDEERAARSWLYLTSGKRRTRQRVEERREILGDHDGPPPEESSAP